MTCWTTRGMRLGTALLFAAAWVWLVATAGCNSKDDEIVLPPPTGNRPLEPDLVPDQEEPTVESKVKVTASVFGKLPDGREVKKYTLDNGTMSVDIIEWGATIVAMRVPDRNGKLENVTLGFPNLDGYLQRHPYFGSTVGRYANRIAHGKFTLQGKTYQLTLNDGPHHLHGGKEGFDRKLWSSRLTEPGENFAGVSFDYTSPDGEEGYPGTLTASVVYTLTTNNELGIQFHAQTDQTTIVNLTNHAYFNLAGAGKGTILDHRLTIVGDRYLPVDDTLIPTGELASVEGTPFDFRDAHAVGERIGKLEGDPGGYDHCFVLTGKRDEAGIRLAAKLEDPASGRILEVLTTQPGLQFYSGNFLDGKPENGGYPKHGGLCLEAQHYPDSPNHKDFPPVVLGPRGDYQQVIVYRFSVAASPESSGK